MTPEPHGVYLTITTTDQGIDKLEGINWFVAATNTWQGAIAEDWPYNNIPQKLNGNFKQDFSNYFPIKLREDVWKYLEEQSDFDDCIAKERYDRKSGETQCDSIFHLSLNSSPLEALNPTNICDSSLHKNFFVTLLYEPFMINEDILRFILRKNVFTFILLNVLSCQYL